MTRASSGIDWLDRWQALDRWLAQLAAVWLAEPFQQPEPAWREQWPDMARWLESLADPELESLAADPQRLVAQLARWLPSLPERDGLIALDAYAAPEAIAASTLTEAKATDMPGRKRLQSGAFAAAIRPLQHPVLDWCCGKGHLTRTLAPWCEQPLTGLEWDAALVDQGNRLVRHYDDRVTLRQQDVMSESLQLPAGMHTVALHACGDLHRRLLGRAATDGAERISLSPCCYHLSATRSHQRLSRRGHSELGELSTRTLRLAVRETVTAPRRERVQGDRMSVWRLGFDALQRHLRGIDAYLPVPSHPTRLLNQEFADFCEWASRSRGLSLPPGIDWQTWQRQGEQRLARVRRHELLRHLFRRPLELWLVLDYALYLEEQGYRVRLGTFTERALTPRNLLLDAFRVCGTQRSPHSHL